MTDTEWLDETEALYEERGYGLHRHVLEKPVKSDTHSRDDGER